MAIDREDKLYLMRLSDSSLRLETIHKLRWIVLENMGNSDNVNDKEYYVEANEILNEMEKETWEYINGESNEEN